MNECPVIVRGEWFPSQKAAATAFGVTPGAVAQRLYQDGHLDRLGLGPGKAGNTNARACAVRIGPYEFRSQKSAAEALGVNRSTLRRALRPDGPNAAKDAVLAAALRLSHERPAGAKSRIKHEGK